MGGKAPGQWAARDGRGAGAGADRCGRVTRSPHLRGVIGAAVIFTPRRRPIVNRLRLVRPRPDAEGRAKERVENGAMRAGGTEAGRETGREGEGE